MWSKLAHYSRINDFQIANVWSSFRTLSRAANGGCRGSNEVHYECAWQRQDKPVRGLETRRQKEMFRLRFGRSYPAVRRRKSTGDTPDSNDLFSGDEED